METTNTTSQLAQDLDEAKNQATTHQSQIAELQGQITVHETGLAAAQTKIKELTKDLLKQLGVAVPKSKGKRPFTPEALLNIREGQKKRWENFHKNKNNNPGTENTPTDTQTETQEGAASVATA